MKISLLDPAILPLSISINSESPLSRIQNEVDLQRFIDENNLTRSQIDGIERIGVDLWYVEKVSRDYKMLTQGPSFSQVLLKPYVIIEDNVVGRVGLEGDEGYPTCAPVHHFGDRIQGTGYDE